MRTRTLWVPTLLATGLVLAACGGPAEESSEDDRPAIEVADPVVVTYDGGLYVLDGNTLEVKQDIPLEGFNRINAAGDGQHVLVSTSTGFRVLDATAAALSEDEFAAAEPGHVVDHAGTTVLFADGSGEVTLFDPQDLGDGLPEAETYTTAEPHHGVAVELANGELVVTLGNEETRSGALVLDAERNEIARSEECPGVHGESAAANETIVLGCENGVLVYRDGAFTKIASADEYGRTGNTRGHEDSPYVLGDYKVDPEAELERPERISIINTETAEMTLLDLGTSYSFRSLARGPQGEGLVLGTDGALHVIDMAGAAVTQSIPVVGAWEEPIEWQEARPTVFVRGGTVYVTEPATSKIFAVDLASGTVAAEAELPSPANELTGV
ncbi:zinc metallochaperone AztD [Glycomyces sp. NPDC048151]|uniref:zinc metallochaperone AztD n=1 Tax=Glycomyces sp. NPDC048151 TaxID=3364002 RepID=UPI0037236CB4